MSCVGRTARFVAANGGRRRCRVVPAGFRFTVRGVTTPARSTEEIEQLRERLSATRAEVAPEDEHQQVTGALAVLAWLRGEDPR